jgi:hypothetical protein
MYHLLTMSRIKSVCTIVAGPSVCFLHRYERNPSIYESLELAGTAGIATATHDSTELYSLLPHLDLGIRFGG